MHSVAEPNHAQDALRRCRGKIHTVHPGVLPVKDMAVHVGKAEILYGWVCGDRNDRRLLVIQFGVSQLRGRDLTVDMGDGFPQLFTEVCAFDRFYCHFLPAVLRVLCCKFPEHHPGMLHKIRVGGMAVRCRPEVYPGRFLQGHAVPFLEKEDVCHYACVGVPHKGVIRETDCAQKVCAPGDIPADRLVLFVHCPTGRDHRDHAAGADQVKGLCDEIVMDHEIMAVVAGIRHFVSSKGHIPDHGIKKAVRERGCLETLNSDVVFLI